MYIYEVNKILVSINISLYSISFHVKNYISYNHFIQNRQGIICIIIIIIAMFIIIIIYALLY